MWYFLRKFLKLLGGNVLSKMAPRLIFFQYFNRPSLELDEQKKKHKLHYKSPAEIFVYRRLIKKPSKKSGISSVLE